MIPGKQPDLFAVGIPVLPKVRISDTLALMALALLAAAVVVDYLAE